MKKMNKKFVALLIPLLLIPATSLAYAHFTDEVVKKYKIHVGSVILNVTGFHVDYAKIPDVDNDGVIFGDELNITIYENPVDCRWYVLIEANPIGGGFQLNTTMWMHNAGKLPFTLTWDIAWDGPYDEDPCYDVVPTKDLPLPDPWTWQLRVWKSNATGIFGPYGRTMTHYKPCNDIIVKQHIGFPQPDDPTVQKEWQCKWIKLWITFIAEGVDAEEVSSWTWGERGPEP